MPLMIFLVRSLTWLVQVDLKCTVSGSGCGGYYYPDHLPVLGELSEFWSLVADQHSHPQVYRQPVLGIRGGH